GRRHVIRPLWRHRLTLAAASSEGMFPTALGSIYLPFSTQRSQDCKERISSYEEFEEQHRKSSKHDFLSDVGNSDRARSLLGQRKEVHGRFHYSSRQIFTRQPEEATLHLQPGRDIE